MKIVVNVIVKQDDSILMVQENWGHVKGLWNLPAGHLDDGEDIFAAAVREAKEETGLNVNLTGFVCVQNAVYDDRHVVHVVFTGEITGGSIAFDESEIKEVKFIKIDDILNMTEENLRISQIQKERIKKVLSGEVYPLEIFSNWNYKTTR